MSVRDHEISLFEYAEGTLPPAPRAALEEHLAACAECRQALAEIRAGDHGFRSIVVGPTPDLIGPVMQRVHQEPPFPPGSSALPPASIAAPAGLGMAGALGAFLAATVVALLVIFGRGPSAPEEHPSRAPASVTAPRTEPGMASSAVEPGPIIPTPVVPPPAVAAGTGFRVVSATGRWHGTPAVKSVDLPEGARLETEADGLLHLAKEGGTLLIVEGETRTAVFAQQVDLERGRLWGEFRPVPPGPGAAAQGPFTITLGQDKILIAAGARFGVQRTASGAIIALFEGQLRVCPATGSEQILEAGTEAVLRAGTVTTSPLTAASLAVWARSHSETTLATSAVRIGPGSVRVASAPVASPITPEAPVDTAATTSAAPPASAAHPIRILQMHRPSAPESGETP
jgi:anti-sigma factor RsiW